MISDNVLYVTSSIPFATLTIICPSFINGDICFATIRTTGEGTAITTTSSSVKAVLRSASIIILSGNFTPGNFSTCSLFVESISISCGSCVHNVTSCPLFANNTARALPQLPAPITLTFFICLSSS